MNYTQLGKRIREERKKIGLTQSKLAEDIDISDAYMGQIERGERSLTLNTLVRLVNRLGISIDYLLKDYVDIADEVIIDNQNLKRKQMALDVLKTIFSHLDDE